MLAIGVGGADAVDAMTGTPWELKAPNIVGELYCLSNSLASTHNDRACRCSINWKTEWLVHDKRSDTSLGWKAYRSREFYHVAPELHSVNAIYLGRNRTYSRIFWSRSY